MNIQSGLEPYQLSSREASVSGSGGQASSATRAVSPESSVTGGGGGSSSALGGASSPAAISHGDTTTISPAALSAVAASRVSDVRSEKVAAIQQGLANGSYAVSPSDVAGKLIDHLLQS